MKRGERTVWTATSHYSRHTLVCNSPCAVPRRRCEVEVLRVGPDLLGLDGETYRRVTSSVVNRDDVHEQVFVLPVREPLFLDAGLASRPPVEEGGKPNIPGKPVKRRVRGGRRRRGHALQHFNDTGGIYPLCVKLGTVTPKGGDVYSYAPSENDMVEDPNLGKHLEHWGINMMKMEKTEKTMAEINIEANKQCVALTVGAACAAVAMLTAAALCVLLMVACAEPEAPLAPEEIERTPRVCSQSSGARLCGRYRKHQVGDRYHLHSHG